MPNEAKYGSRGWPPDSPISRERLSTSGEHTGQHRETVVQNSLYDAGNRAYLKARETVRYGTLTPDTGDNNSPDRLVTVEYTVTEAVGEIFLSGVAYNTRDKVSENVLSKAKSFTFKDRETPRTATGVDGIWSVT